MIKICIPYISQLGVRRETVEAINALPTDRYRVCRCHGTLLEQQRNALVNDLKSSARRQRLSDDFTDYLFWDSDVGATPEQVEQLLDSDSPVIGAAYTPRTSEGCYTAGWWKKGFPPGIIGDYVNSDQTGIHRVDWIGWGLTRVKREVFEGMDYPWIAPETVVYQEYAEVIRDDAAFGRKCAKNGIPIYVNCDIVAQHYR